MTAKLADHERERRRRDRRDRRQAWELALEIAREAEHLAFLANDIRNHNGPEEFPGIIDKIEPFQSPALITALRILDADWMIWT